MRGKYQAGNLYTDTLRMLNCVYKDSFHKLKAISISDNLLKLSSSFYILNLLSIKPQLVIKIA